MREPKTSAHPWLTAVHRAMEREGRESGTVSPGSALREANAQPNWCRASFGEPQKMTPVRVTECGGSPLRSRRGRVPTPDEPGDTGESRRGGLPSSRRPCPGGTRRRILPAGHPGPPHSCSSGGGDSMGHHQHVVHERGDPGRKFRQDPGPITASNSSVRNVGLNLSRLGCPPGGI